jgi:hypothetical protein
MGLKSEAVGEFDYRLTVMPPSWSVRPCRSDCTKTHYGDALVMLTTHVEKLGSQDNRTDLYASCEDCFHVYTFDMPATRRSRVNRYWLFGGVHGLRLGGPDLDAAWEEQADATKEWYAETCRLIKKRPTTYISVFVPVDNVWVNPWRASFDARLSKIKDMFDSDVALGKIHTKTCYIDYVNDMLCNEPYN